MNPFPSNSKAVIALVAKVEAGPQQANIALASEIHGIYCDLALRDPGRLLTILIDNAKNRVKKKRNKL